MKFVEKIDTGNHVHTVDPIGQLGLPLSVAVYSRTEPGPTEHEWLEASADASDIEAAITAVRTLLTDTETPYTRVEITLRPGYALVEGKVRSSAS